MSNSTPTTAASAIWRGEYRTLCPVSAQTASITTPAMEKRTAHISAGGIVCTAMSMARYVDPQNRYTSPKARITIHRLGRCAECMGSEEKGKLKHIRRVGTPVGF